MDLTGKDKRKPIYKLKYMVSNSDTNEEAKNDFCTIFSKEISHVKLVYGIYCL